MIRVQNTFRKMKEIFGASCCRLILINSRADPANESVAASPDIWGPVMPRYDAYKKKPSDAPILMTAQDVQYIMMLVDEFITNGLVPHMERKIRAINTTAVQQKKGLKSKLTSWFTTKKKEDDNTKHV